MDLSTIAFALMALITVGSGVVVVFANRLIHAVFALLFTFFGTAGLYVFLGADFVAGAQVMVYVGGILVLLLFGVMLTNRIYDMRILAERVNFKRSVIIVGIGFALLAGVMLKTPWNAVTKDDPASSTAEIGSALMTTYLLPFEVAAILLLAALIGASMLASGGEGEDEGEA
ncbi:TPA: NADH-quinone oxidoreductase subunit J [Candidatus Latescibacteria bacterium]|nr:NADH-quinone oxidoreductase subunit J [Gemmatimonadota bacterium]HAA75534.1 NADH-quinone oxidoreductase subunit J [Candidatus Latescibacterota bacterium]